MTADSKHDISIAFACEQDVPLILDFISQLAAYEKLSHEMVATAGDMREALFGSRRLAECLIARLDGKPAGFALFFHNFSTFLGRGGIYLEDLFVNPAHRGHGVGKAMLARLAQIAVERNCGRFEWSVLDWNKPAIDFYTSLGAKAMDEWTIYRVTGDALQKLAGGE
jgi:GNAT superfamily N-acetyltransferase